MYVVIGLTGILAGVISGIVGTGSSIMLLPALTYTFGPKTAIPVMAISAIVGNISRVILWRKDINIRAFLLYAVPGIPAAILGANTLWEMPARLSNICIGTFFFLLIPLRHYARCRAFTLSSMQLALAGALTGFLTGVVFSTGPLTIPVFAGFGLVKGALLSTEAAASFAIYFAKASTFSAIGAMPWPVLFSGLLVGSTLAAGMLIGKKFVIKMSETYFNRLIDILLFLAGISLFWNSAKGD
ncbi:sulfite exporter TauE/SafE family protein [Rahnella aquatilis]|uniref:Probable membrane transporter protein n=1 Tax=Rahnella aquatilis (strain ATCC 33071 / DSM 4594 / JCM 1683 / NBRC 105701 / NCIMB 13365 / CIP 78.65) TaxID=745277 RepID=H2J251_RAHAC|nr:sulfite exporter TauE/SafE family protein [Rahnella aquatilis]AEX54648.1 putative permease [Rahnella aquatilis CIP 78.65 = ATCC 33071]